MQPTPVAAPASAPINMSAVRAALMSRIGAGAPPTGSPLNQLSLPNAGVPGGGPNTPTLPAPPVPQPATPGPANSAPPTGGPNPAQQLAGIAQQAQGANFDPETSAIAKALVGKLLKVI